MPTLQDFKRPQSVAEAVAMVREGSGRGGFVAGGTSLGLARMVPYDYLVDITGIGLNEIRRDGESVRIGAAVTIGQLAISPVLAIGELQFLMQAVLSVATRQIRNMATVGGDLVSGYPMADLPAAFLVLEAKLSLAGVDQETILLRDFLDPAVSRGLNGGLVTEIIFPVPPPDSRGTFIKFARTENDVALFDLACLVRLKGDQFEEVRVALGCTTPLPLRLTAMEEFLQGKRVQAKVVAQAVELATQDLPILDNIRGGRTYRKQMVGVLLRRTLLASVGKGGGSR
ncbi:FAD binding domain-containing protein [bacterium]|nr:FAD binding domain-containing protein [bacterium]